MTTRYHRDNAQQHRKENLKDIRMYIRIEKKLTRPQKEFLLHNLHPEFRDLLIAHAAGQYK